MVNVRKGGVYILNDVMLLTLLCVVQFFIFAGVLLVVIKVNALEDAVYSGMPDLHEQMPDPREDEREEEELEKYFADSYERNLELDKRTEMLKAEIARSHIGTTTTQADPVAGLYDLDASTIPYKEKVEHEYAD